MAHPSFRSRQPNHKRGCVTLPGFGRAGCHKSRPCSHLCLCSLTAIAIVDSRIAQAVSLRVIWSDEAKAEFYDAEQWYADISGGCRTHVLALPTRTTQAGAPSLPPHSRQGWDTTKASGVVALVSVFELPTIAQARSSSTQARSNPQNRRVKMRP